MNENGKTNTFISPTSIETTTQISRRNEQLLMTPVEVGFHDVAIDDFPEFYETRAI